MKTPIAILISGRGSNMEALLHACANAGYPATVRLVLANRPEAGGLAVASAMGIPTRVLRHQDYHTREAFDAAMDGVLREAGVTLLCLAGFMRLLTPGFVMAWENRILNIHPSLLPSFKGLHTHRQALEAGVKWHGCTVHLVRPAMDEGPILAQAVVPVQPEDTESTLAARVLVEEHRCYVEALRQMAEGRVRVAGLRTWVAEATG